MIVHYIQEHDEEAAVRVDVDLSFGDDEPDLFRPMLVWVFIKMRECDEKGLCLGAECTRLQQVREALCQTLGEHLGAHFSGSRMSDGWFEVYFYARNGKGLVNAAGEAMQHFSGYTFDTGSAPDDGYEHYEHELYPDELMLHQIQNRRIIKELQEEGDDLTQERVVEHYFFFQLVSQLERAVQRLEAEGFQQKKCVEQEGDYCYGVVMEQAQSIEEYAMMDCVEDALNIASQEHGVYEGWSTTLSTTIVNEDNSCP